MLQCGLVAECVDDTVAAELHPSDVGFRGTIDTDSGREDFQRKQPRSEYRVNIDPSSASGRSTRGTFNLDDDPTIIGGIRIKTRDNAHGGGLSNTDMTRYGITPPPPSEYARS